MFGQQAGNYTLLYIALQNIYNRILTQSLPFVIIFSDNFLSIICGVIISRFHFSVLLTFSMNFGFPHPHRLFSFSDRRPSCRTLAAAFFKIDPSASLACVRTGHFFFCSAARFSLKIERTAHPFGGAVLSTIVKSLVAS